MEPSDLHTATLEAFYTRVMQRVCSSYLEESELPADEAIERLRQKWQEKLALYTGHRPMTEDNCNEISVVEASSYSDVEASDGDDSISVSSSSSSSTTSSKSDASEHVIGRPSVQLPSVATSTPSSIFSKMLGGKRKLQQLDGSASDDEETVDWQDAAEQEEQDIEEGSAVFKALPTVVPDAGANEGSSTDDDTIEMEYEIQDDCEEKEEKEDGGLPSSPSDSSTSTSSLASTSLLVSAEDLSPVSGLSGINLPLQLAAEYSKFTHRGKRRGYFGQLHAIVLTWPSRLGPSETVHPGELVWCCPNSEQGLLGEGELVKVLSLGDTLHDLRIELSNGTETTVRMDRVRRLKEYLICKGSVQFRSEQVTG